MKKEQYVMLLMQASDTVIAEFTGRSVEDVSYHASQGTLGDVIAAAYDAKKSSERINFLGKHFPDALIEHEASKTNPTPKKGGKRR